MAGAHFVNVTQDVINMIEKMQFRRAQKMPTGLA